MRSHINRGNQLLSRRLYKEAIDEYENALNIDPGNKIATDNIGLVHNNWGTEYFNLRRFQEAKKEWEKALSINPNDSIARRNLQVLAVHMRRRRPAKNPKADFENGDLDEDEEEDMPRPHETPPTDNHGSQNKSENKPALSKTAEQPTVILSTGNDKIKLSNDGVVIGAPKGQSAGSTGRLNPQSSIDAETKFNSNSNTKSDPFTSSDAEEEEEASAPQVSRPPQQSLSNSKETAEKSSFTTIDTVLKDSIETLKKARKDRDEENSQSKGKGFTIKKNDPNHSPSKTENKEKEERKEGSQKETDTDIDSDLSISELLSRLEKEVFGEERNKQPILNRLTQLEKDTLGKKQSGTVKDRIKKLNETYGL